MRFQRCQNMKKVYVTESSEYDHFVIFPLVALSQKEASNRPSA